MLYIRSGGLIITENESCFPSFSGAPTASHAASEEKVSAEPNERQEGKSKAGWVKGNRNDVWWCINKTKKRINQQVEKETTCHYLDIKKPMASLAWSLD